MCVFIVVDHLALEHIFVIRFALCIEGGIEGIAGNMHMHVFVRLCVFLRFDTENHALF